MSAKITTTQIRLVASTDLLQEIADEAREALRRQLSDGVDATGVQHEGWDFRETGELLGTMTTAPGEVVFVAEHAQYLPPMDGLVSPYQEQFEKQIEPLVQQKLKAEE